MEEEIAKGYDKLSDIENYKQINEDFESGRTFLIDYKDNIECNIFGIPLIKCHPNVTGQKSYKYRLNKNLIKQLQYNPPQYLPNTPHLVGSSMYPRPNSIPFNNHIEKSEKLINLIKKEEIFNLCKNKNMFDLEKEIKEKQTLPSFFCVKLGADSPKTREYLINMFEEYIKMKKKDYNNEPKYYLKDSHIKGLTEYKNFLKKNLTKNIFNGKKIPYSKQNDINNKFKIIKKLVKKDGWNKMHLERLNINYETYNKLYQIKSVGDKNNMFKKNFSSDNFYDNKILDKNNETKKNIDSYPNTIDNYKNEKIKNTLISKRQKDNIHHLHKKSRQKILYDSNILNNQSKKIFNYSSFQSNYNKSMNKLGSTVTTCFNYNNESQISKNIIPVKKEIYTPKNLHHFQRSLSTFNTPKNNLDKINDDEENKKNEDKKENIEEKEIYDINDSQEINNKKRIKKLNEIKENCEHENKLIKGYQPPPEIEELDLTTKRKSPNYASPISVYKKEIEMFKKVNPIEYERELKKKLFDDKMLLKKMRNRKIYERIKIKK